MMREISIHNDDVCASGELKTMDIGGTQAKLTSTRLQLLSWFEINRDKNVNSKSTVPPLPLIQSTYNTVFAIDLLEFLCNLLGAVRTVVIYNNDLPINSMFLECLCKQPGDDGQILAFIVGGENHCILVLSHVVTVAVLYV